MSRPRKKRNPAQPKRGPDDPKRGPLSQITPELQAAICKRIRQCCYVGEAVVACGVMRRTYYEWLRLAFEGRKAGKTNVYTRFADAVEQASAEAEASLVDGVHKAATSGDRRLRFDAQRFLLQTKFPARWGRTLRVEELAPGQLAKMSDEQLEQKMSEHGVIEPTPGSGGG